MGQRSRSGNSQSICKPSDALAKLKKRAAELKSESKSPATKKAYEKDFELFARWAKDAGVFQLPATAETIVLYITHLDEIGRKPATITRVLTSISQAHKLLNLPSPTVNPQITEVLKGIRRRRGTAQRQVKPLLPADIRKIVRAIPPDMCGTRDKAMILIGWSGALRRSELVGLDLVDVDRVDEGIVLTIKQSKGDQEKAGQKVAIPLLENEFCPVAAVEKWQKLAQLEAAGPLFCPIGFGGKNRFWNTIDRSKRLSCRMVALIVKKYCEVVGLNPAHYSAHSLRAGWTTAAAAISTPPDILMRHTRHKSFKSTLTYIRAGQLFTNNPLPLLLSSQERPK